MIPACRRVTPLTGACIWLHREPRRADFQIGSPDWWDLLTSDTAITTRGYGMRCVDTQVSRHPPPEQRGWVTIDNRANQKDAGQRRVARKLNQLRPGAVAQVDTRCNLLRNAACGTCCRGSPWRRGCTMKQGPGITAFQRGAHEGGASTRTRHPPSFCRPAICPVRRSLSGGTPRPSVPHRARPALHRLGVDAFKALTGGFEYSYGQMVLFRGELTRFPCGSGIPSRSIRSECVRLHAAIKRGSDGSEH